MGAGVIQVFALEPNLGPAAMLSQPFGEIERRGATDVVFEQIVEFCLKGRVAARGFVLFGQLIERMDERFGDIAAAKVSKTSCGIGYRGCCCHI